MMRREPGRGIAGWHPTGAPEVDDNLHSSVSTVTAGGRPGATWRADTDERSHEKAEIEAAAARIAVSGSCRALAMRPPHPTGFVAMRIRALQSRRCSAQSPSRRHAREIVECSGGRSLSHRTAHAALRRTHRRRAPPRCDSIATRMGARRSTETPWRQATIPVSGLGPCGGP